MKILTTFTVLFFCISSFNFQNRKNDLIGKWACYHKELEDGTTNNTDIFSGKKFKYSCDGLTIELKSNLTGWESMGELNFKYELKDSILTLGNRLYVVELLNKKELIIRDYKPDGLSISNFRQKFTKIE